MIVSRLHLLIDRCVRRRHAEGEVNLPAEAMEKDMLLSLSQVSREIQSWISEAGLDSASVGLFGAKKNVHVQHLAGNILVQVSDSLVESGSPWDDFIRLLCDSLHLALVYSCPLPSPTGFEGSDIGSVVLKGEMKKANWCTVSGIFRVLRNILKRLGQEENEELIDVYLESVNSTLAKIPWSRVDTHFSNRHGHNGTLGSIGNSEEGTVFLGNFVQFLSTVVQQVRFPEDSDAFGTTHLILQKITELVPDLLRLCQPKLESQSGSSMSRYLVHKHADKDCEFDCRKKGMEGVFKWIEQQVPGDTFLDHGTYSKKSVDFSTCFIQLFMHEDDLLFKVLLQLLSVPLAGEELLKGEERLLQDKEICVRISTLFNPVILFCIFLSELHFDHQVLLDYLISKDIGASCAEYLLRCLRTVCDSWTLFVEFPFEENINDSSSKRRRLLVETPEVEQNQILHPQAFENAKECLLSLQNSIVRLHQKKLFPYNPEALLRRQFVKVSRALSTPRDLYAIVILLIEKYLTSQFSVSQSQLRFY
ncbi:hypothetical protein YC2023_010214 [Brassica napus]